MGNRGAYTGGVFVAVMVCLLDTRAVQTQDGVVNDERAAVDCTGLEVSHGVEAVSVME